MRAFVVALAWMAIAAGCGPQVAPAPTPTLASPTDTPPPTPTATREPTPTPACPEPQVRRFLEDFEDLAEHFDDVNELASNTPRMQLAPIVRELQELRREAKELEGPECADPVSAALVDWMDLLVAGYLAFLSDTAGYQKRFERAENAYVDFRFEMARMTALIEGTDPPAYLRAGQPVQPTGDGRLTGYKEPRGSVAFSVSSSDVREAEIVEGYAEKPDWVLVRLRTKDWRDGREAWFRWSDWQKALR